jgi:hypothetical protein
MSISLSYVSNLTVTEVLANNTVSYSAGNRTVKSTLFNTAGTYGAASTPAVSAHAASEVSLTAGAATLDLSALTGANGVEVDLSAKAVKFAKFMADAENEDAITITPAVSDGYELLGSSFSVTLEPGQEIMLKLADSAPTVGASAKDLALAGTGTDKLSYSIVAG